MTRIKKKKQSSLRHVIEHPQPILPLFHLQSSGQSHLGHGIQRSLIPEQPFCIQWVAQAEDKGIICRSLANTVQPDQRVMQEGCLESQLHIPGGLMH